MRKRSNQIVVLLSDKENKKFIKDIGISGLSRSDYLRKLILKKEIKQRTPAEYSEIIYHMAKIGNNVNQIAKKANETNQLSVSDAKQAVLLMEKCYEIVKALE